MREQSPAHYFGIDIGTSVVRCVVGTIDATDSSKISIIGHGSAPNLGMRKGVVVHVDDVAEATIHAVTEAERLTGIRIDRATVNINGAHISGMNSKGVIAISAANKEITAEDRLRVEEAATIVQIPPNREIVQVFARNYRLDGQDNIKDPVGMQGVRLEVDTHIVSVSVPALKSLDSVLEKAGIYPNHHTVSGLAAAEAVLNRQQKEAGTLLLDIGAGTTNLAILEDGEVQHVAIIPVGGTHITNDLAIGLKTDLDIAEKVKVRHASLELPIKKVDVGVDHEGKHYRFNPEDIHMIISARVEELFELVDKELKKIQKSRKLPGGVVIVGGTANIPGLADFAKDKLQLAVRIGQLQPIGGLADVLQSPEYATAVGLMMLDVLLMPSGAAPGGPNAKAFGMIDGLIKRIKRS